MEFRKIHLVIIYFLIASNFSYAQPFQIGHTTINFTDVSRSNRVIAAEIYYPSDVAGDNVALTTSTTVTFPVLSFGHGFVMTSDAYQNFWNFLVPNGYVMVFPKTESSLSPSHLDFGKDLSFLIDQMTALGNNSSSIFYNRISSMNCVMGHSMGGGASFLSAQINSNIKTLLTFSPAEISPSAIQAASSIAIPSLIFAGVNDCVTPPNTNQIPMYNGLVSTCKSLISIIGGSHCQMANSNFFCGIGESTCTPQPTITRTAQQNTINRYILPWLDYQLKGNCVQGNLFDNQIIADNSITFQKNCIQCTSLSTENSSLKNQIVLTPNPAKEFIKVTAKADVMYQISIFDIAAKCILTKQFIGEVIINTSEFAKGIYFYTIKNKNNNWSNGKFIKE
ncbi:T9SS type A sorting domain-containing protein [Flavobacterium paronense]|uniref:T9SS type A sorting domain-containing protein n=1 Tax=Flavobacterium paronense TaxID=1392775 RepID=A0ABV5GG90_9FLAO|nr:T9SS type A sorting domain-containing protein [Flavobacterium paronense]MDN3677034.1 T9SS type A sorting domain-containing protein [Flavobacterium paronense]